MEADKENYKRIKKTRIPVPCRPLPPIPDHLLTFKDIKEISKRRAPLGDLNNDGNLASSVNKQIKPTQRIAYPSVSSTNRDVKQALSIHIPFKVDTRYLTQRRRIEEQLDWNNRVFSAFVENKSVVSISDDESYLNDSNLYVDSLRRSTSTSDLTPRTQLPNKRIKKLKRSLKRPHSRELQGLSATGERKKKDARPGKVFLSCNSRFTKQLEPPSPIQCTYMTALTKSYTDGIFKYLFEAELRSKRPDPKITSNTRACVINWLIKVNGSRADGNPAVIQSACWYLDSILMTHRVAVNNLQLVAAACYWIALKLNGPAMIAEHMALFAGNAFTTEKLLYAEKSVIRKLKFPPQPVVPQDFIAYMSLWCDSSHPGEIETAATFLCLAGLMVDKSLCAELPSVIAAASIRNALVLLKKEEWLFHISLCPVYVEVQKKVADPSMLDAILRKAIRTVSSPNYEYNSILQYFKNQPFAVADKIIKETLNMRADGNPAVIQSACWYLDSILMTHRVAVNNLQLVAAACYWIALKLNGPPMIAEHMALFAGNAFTTEKLLYAEKSVIRKLKFPPQPVVPQDFIAYMSLWCDSSHPGEIETAATFLCLAGLMVDKSLCAELPSVIAAASIRNALVLLKKEEWLFHISLCPVYVEVQKKVADPNMLDAILRKAIRTVSSPNYEYNSILQYFKNQPFAVADKIIKETLNMVHIDAGYGINIW